MSNIPRISTATASRNATLDEMLGGTVALNGSVKLTLPQTGGKGNQITVLALGDACQIQSADGLMVGADGGSSNLPSTSTSAITLRRGESRTYVRFGGAAGDKWYLVHRTAPTDAIALGSSESAVIGTGDGSTVHFDLPADEIAGLLVWVNGTIQAPSAYSISAGAGTAGVDRLVFASAPTDTHPILAFYIRKTTIG